MYYSRQNPRRPGYGFRGRYRGPRRGFGFGRARGARSFQSPDGPRSFQNPGGASFHNPGDFRKRGDERSGAEGTGFQPAQDAAQDAGPYRSKFCKFCKRKGHWWQDCYDLKFRLESGGQVFQ